MTEPIPKALDRRQELLTTAAAVHIDPGSAEGDVAVISVFNPNRIIMWSRQNGKTALQTEWLKWAMENDKWPIVSFRRPSTAGR